MSVKVFPLDFLGKDALLQPKWPKLHDLAIDFCARELVEEVNLAQFQKVFIAAEVDAQDEPQIVKGISGFLWRPDIALFRATCASATTKLHHRWHTHFADNGLMGNQVLIYLNGKETSEQRCANWNNEMMSAEAIPADRYLVKVRAK